MANKERQSHSLPTGWAQCTIGDLASYVNGRAFKPSEWKDVGRPIIRIQNLNDPAATYNYSPEDHEKKFRVQPGDLLFAWSASLGAYIWNGEEAWLNQHIFRVDLRDGVDKRYVYYLLDRITAELYAKAHGSGMVHVTKGKFEETKVDLPPTAEQLRIVSKIDQLISELDQGIENLQTARGQLRVYRQAVLKHAFEGKLTEKWRKENQAKLVTPRKLLERVQAERETRYQEQLDEWDDAVQAYIEAGEKGRKPRRPKLIAPASLDDLSPKRDRGTLPIGWHWVPLSWILSCEAKPMTTGPFGTLLKKSEHQPDGVSVLGIENIGEGGFIPGNKIFVTEQKAAELQSFRVFPQDIIISRSGTVGEICEVPDDIGHALISTNLIRVALNQRVIRSRFFVQMFQGGGGVKAQVKELCKGSSRDFLNQTILKSIAYPLCSLEEQGEIVKLLDERLSRIDQMDNDIGDQLLRVEALRQSILKRALSGQLIEQDLNDEPASVLLSRIQAEKERQEKAKRVSKKKVKKKAKRKDAA